MIAPDWWDWPPPAAGQYVARVMGSEHTFLVTVFEEQLYEEDAEWNHYLRTRRLFGPIPTDPVNKKPPVWRPKKGKVKRG